ncbi:MAG TPA: hypothetical protein VGN23_17045 [Verrucomicrobiae bacterium]
MNPSPTFKNTLFPMSLTGTTMGRWGAQSPACIARPTFGFGVLAEIFFPLLCSLRSFAAKNHFLLKFFRGHFSSVFSLSNCPAILSLHSLLRRRITDEQRIRLLFLLPLTGRRSGGGVRQTERQDSMICVNSRRFASKSLFSSMFIRVHPWLRSFSPFLSFDVGRSKIFPSLFPLFSSVKKISVNQRSLAVKNLFPFALLEFFRGHFSSVFSLSNCPAILSLHSLLRRRITDEQRIRLLFLLPSTGRRSGGGVRQIERQDSMICVNSRRFPSKSHFSSVFIPWFKSRLLRASIGQPSHCSQDVLSLFLLQVEKVRMRTGFKNALPFKSTLRNLTSKKSLSALFEKSAESVFTRVHPWLRSFSPFLSFDVGRSKISPSSFPSVKTISVNQRLLAVKNFPPFCAPCVLLRPFFDDLCKFASIRVKVSFFIRVYPCPSVVKNF